MNSYWIIFIFDGNIESTNPLDSFLLIYDSLIYGEDEITIRMQEMSKNLNVQSISGEIQNHLFMTTCRFIKVGVFLALEFGVKNGR